MTSSFDGMQPYSPDPRPSYDASAGIVEPEIHVCYDAYANLPYYHHHPQDVVDGTDAGLPYPSQEQSEMPPIDGPSDLEPPLYAACVEGSEGLGSKLLSKSGLMGKVIDKGIYKATEALHRSKDNPLGTTETDGVNSSRLDPNSANVINIPIQLPNGEYVKPNRPSGTPPPRPPPPTQPYRPQIQPSQPLYPSLTSTGASISSSERPTIVKFASQDYSQLKRRLLERRELFADPHFPASNRLLASEKDQYVQSYWSWSNKYSPNSIEWLRPHEICQRNRYPPPQMFVGESDRFDINQGELGNCWFLAAVANLAENRQCFRRVVPKDVDGRRSQSFETGRYAGIFRFRFWRFGNWVEVVVDDLLPCRNGKLIYLRSVEKNEFWGALLEKAYAKLNGSYRSLIGGLTIEAAVDFTGGVPELIDLSNLKMARERLFYIMAKADDRGAFMGCALGARRAADAQRMGLQARHAYTITKVVEIRSGNMGIQLVRLRNPHGNHNEWKGAWSDNDRYWNMIPESKKSELGLTKDDDGEFYMSFRDFLLYFGELEICHLTPESVSIEDANKQFEVFSWHSEWRRGVTAGGCGNDGGKRSFATNPQFFVTLNDPDPYDDEDKCPVIISVAQKQKVRRSEHAIGFKVFQCDLSDKKLDETFFYRNVSIDRFDTFMNLREISKRILLPAGRYCIIPCTFERGNEGDFLLRVFVEKKWGQADGAKGQSFSQQIDTGSLRRVEVRRRETSTEILDDTDGSPEPPPFTKQRRKRDKLWGAMASLRKHLPQEKVSSDSLRSFYTIAKDADTEYELLKKIIATLK